jgi:glycosyltransferase involved in cell wall biosynthesis
MPGILQVIQHGELRGAEVFALDLCGALRRRGGWEVSLLSLFGIEPAYRATAEAAGFPIQALCPAGRARGLDPRLVFALRRRIDASTCQIVQANGAATLKYLVAARHLSRRRWRLVYRAIGMGSFWRRSAGRRLLYRWLFSQPDRIVAVSEVVADDLIRTTGIGPERIAVIANGVEPARIRAEPADRDRVRRTLGVAPSEHLLLYAGSLAPEKNLPALVRAVAECRRQGAAVKALLIGDGSCRDDLLQRAQACGLGDALYFLPGQDRIGSFLAAADLCVLPSLSEGMPALLIEAGLAGVPAVAYAVGGVGEVIADGITGVLVRSGDEHGLTAAIAALLAAPERREAMGRAARIHCRRFEITAITEAYSEVYAGILNGRHR